MNAAQDALRRLRGRNYVFERDLQEMIQESDKTKELPEVTYVDFYVKRLASSYIPGYHSS